MKKKNGVIQLLISGLILLAAASQGQEPVQRTQSLPMGNTLLNEQTLKGFFDKLRNIKASDRQVTILQLGDSHMQMGYFAQEMRSYLGKHFSLSGIGNIFPYPIAKYRPFYIQTRAISGNWEGKNYLRPEDDFKFGVAGFTIKTIDPKAVLEILPQRYPDEIATGNRLVMYYCANDNTTVTVDAFNTAIDSNTAVKSDLTRSTTAEDSSRGWKKLIFDFHRPVNKIRLSVSQNRGGVPFYLNGIRLLNRDKKGVIYDNCGVGGAQFSSLANQASFAISQIKDLNPDLIILSYGSNESYTPSFRYAAYHDMVDGFISSLKKELPETAIILTSAPDTRSKDRYPRNTDSIGLAFRQVATEKEVAYWDLRKQMGGDGSLYKWLKLGLASKDKLHFTKDGYALQADLLLEALFHAYNEYVDEQERIALPAIIPNFRK